MGSKILIGIIIFAAAALITILERRCSFIKSIGAVTVCYALGGIISITGIPYDKAFCETVASVAVAEAKAEAVVVIGRGQLGIVVHADNAIADVLGHLDEGAGYQRGVGSGVDNGIDLV